MRDGGLQLEFGNLVRLRLLVAILRVGSLVERLESYETGRGLRGGLLRGLYLMEWVEGGEGEVGV